MVSAEKAVASVLRTTFMTGLVALAACAGGSASGGGAPTSGLGAGGTFAQIACGDFHSCVRTATGRVMCWGRDKGGELGDEGKGGASQTRPTLVPGLEGVAEIALGASFGCARLRDGTVRCWGSGKILGDDTNADKIPPTAVRGVADVVEVRAGGFVTCVRTSAGAARCWGLDTVRKGAPEKDVAEVAAASSHACARMNDGSARCWGEGVWGGQTKVSFATPGVKGARTISTGDSFACVAAATGAPQCWGRDDQGELGVNPDEDDHTTPVEVRGVAGPVLRLASYESASCAELADRTLACWGDNSDGELGRGDQTTQELAGPVKGLGPVADFAVGADHVCAITTDGAIHCWGNNRTGQIGDGTNESRFAPVKVAVP